MDTWEYRTVRVASDGGNLHEITTIGPDGDTTYIEGQDASVNRVVRALSELGKEGWQVVQVEHLAEHAEVRLFWLKRRLS